MPKGINTFSDFNSFFWKKNSCFDFRNRYFYSLISELLFLSLLVSALNVVKGKFGKAAASIAVGASLLAAFPEAQAQNNVPPKVREVILDLTRSSDLSSGFHVGVWLNFSGSHWRIGFSAIAYAAFTDLQNGNDHGTAEWGLTLWIPFPFNSYFGGGYYLVDIYQPSARSSEWIELWIYVDPVTGYVDAWVQDDSAGRSYHVDVRVWP